MRKTIPLLLITAMVLASCGRLRDTRLNPFNWFGRAESRELSAAERNPLIPRRSALAAPEAEDTRTAVGTITELRIERLPGGAIVRATAVSERQGAHDVALRLIETDDVPENLLRYQMVAYQPVNPAGTQLSRTVSAAVRVSDQDLLQIQRIEVVGAQNALTTRR